MNKYLPKAIYRVTRKGGEYRYAESAGKTYANISHARAYRTWLNGRGAESEIYVCYPDWKLLEDD